MPESVGTVHLNISADLDTLGAQLRSRLSKLGPELGRSFSDQFSSAFSKNLTPAMTSAVRKAFDTASRSIGALKVDIDVDTAAVQAKLDRISAEHPSVKVATDVDTAAAKARISELDNEHPTVKIDVDLTGIAAAFAEIEALKHQLKELNSQSGSSTNGLSRGFKDLSSGINEVTGGISTIGALGVASMGTLIPVAVAATGAVLALGTAAAGVGASFVVAGLAFSGVGAALTALNNQESKAGENAAQAQTAALSLAGAYDSLKSARQGVADAEHQAGLATQQAAQQTAAAAQAVQDAQVAAAQQTAAAERTLRQAQADELQTQKDLNAAREQAIRDLEDIANRAADAALNQRQAALDLTDAEANYQKVLSNPRATQDQKDRAKLTRDQAAQRKKEADEEAKRSAADAAKAKKAGVEGSSAVTTARQREKDAVTAVGSAEKGLVQARLDGERNVLKAEQDLTRARQNEGEVARKNSESIAKAEQGVIQAQRGVQAALIATQQIGSTTRNAVNEAFADLSPAAQHFAKFIFGLKGDLDTLRAAASTALLPPLERAIKILLPYLPQVKAFVSSVGAAMGDVAIKIARSLTGPEWKAFFTAVRNEAPGAIRTLGDIFVSLGKTIAKVFTAAAPYAKPILDGIKKFFDRIDQKATPGKLKKIFDGIMPTLAAVWNVVSAIGQVIKSIATAGSDGQGSAADTLNKVADAFNKLATYIDRHPDTVQKLAQLAAGLVALKAASPVISTIGSIGQALGGLAGVLNLFKKGGFIAGLFAEGGLLSSSGLMVTGLEAVGAAFAAVTAPVWIVIGVIVAVGVALFLLYTRCKWFHDTVNAIVHKIGDFFVWLWNVAIRPALKAIEAQFWFLYNHVIRPVWQLIKLAIDIAWASIEVIWGLIQISLKILGAAFSWLWTHVISPVWTWIKDHITVTWNRYIKPVLDVIGSYIQKNVAPKFRAAVTALGTIWDALKEAFKAPIRFVIETVLNNGLLAAYNKLAKFFHVKPDDVHIDLPSMLQPASKGPSGGNSPAGGGRTQRAFATGGSVFGPGTETSDSIPALLSTGEHVWTAREVRAIGGHSAVEALRAAALRGIVPRFADGGGVFSWVKNAAGSVWNKAKDIGGAIKDFATDPMGALKRLASSALNGLPGGKSGLLGKVITGSISTLAGGIANFAQNLMGFGGDGGSPGPMPSGSGVQRWAPMVTRALAALGLSPSLLSKVLRQMATESGGNPGITQQIHDVNSGGNEARGLMQVIPPTFRAFHVPGTSNNIFDPWANIMAGLSYARSRYGPNLNSLGEGHGYDSGGWLMPGSTLVQNNTGKPEAVFSPSQWSVLESNLQGVAGGDGKTTNINVQTGYDPEGVAKAIYAEQARRDLLDAITA